MTEQQITAMEERISVLESMVRRARMEALGAMALAGAAAGLAVFL